MARSKAQGPTEKELAILKVLWRQGPSTVRQINDEINKQLETGYTTTLKLMQIMTDKERTQLQMLYELVQKSFGGSAEKLVMRALAAKEVSAEELKKIRQLLDKMED